MSRELTAEVKARLREGATKAEIERELAGRSAAAEVSKVLAFYPERARLERNRSLTVTLVALIVTATVLKLLNFFLVIADGPMPAGFGALLVVAFALGVALPAFVVWTVWQGLAQGYTAVMVLVAIGLGRAIPDVPEALALGPVGVASVVITFALGGGMVAVAWMLSKRVYGASAAAAPAAA